jgi:hypothetical protein
MTDLRILLWLAIEWIEDHALGLGVLLAIAGLGAILWGMSYGGT